MALISTLLLLASASIVGWFLFCKYLRDRHSHWKFFVAKTAFKLYVTYQRYLGRTKHNPSISLELYLMDDFFRQYFKPDLCNHSIQTAQKLLKETRSARTQFALNTVPPITNYNNITLQTDNICDTKVIWLKNTKNNKNNSNNQLIISLHGGACVAGSAESCLPYLMPICDFTGINGLSINYNLCPEYPLPFAVNRILNIIKYLMNNNDKNNKNRIEKIAIIGDSAGGTLLMLLLQKIAKECCEMMPVCGITISCWDIPTEGESYLRNRDKDSLLDQATGKVWAQMAVGNIDKNGKNTNKNAQLNDVMYSYLNENNTLKGFPPLLLTFSEWECLCDDSLRIVDKCKECNVDVEIEMTQQCGLHVLEVLQGYDIPEAKQLIVKEAKFILKCMK